MTQDERNKAIEEAEQIICCGGNCMKIGIDGRCTAKEVWNIEARAILAPMFDKIAALEAENAALRSNNQTLDQVMSDISGDLGCSCDNESILEAIHALRERLVVDDAMVKRAEIAWAMAFYRERYRESSSYRCMRAALTAALANKDDPT